MSMDELRAMASKRYELDQLPEEINATFKSFEFKDDANKRHCLFVVFETAEEEEFTQKYTPMHITDFIEAAEALDVGTLDDLKGKTLKLKKKSYNIGNPRMYPVEVL